MLPLYGALGPLGRAYNVAAEASVYDDAIALWKLDEASGTRADSIGSNDLTDNNTVGYANLGPRQTWASFVAASSEYLKRNDNYGFANGAMSNSITINVWVKTNPSAADGYHNTFSLGNYTGISVYTVGGKIAFIGAGTFDGSSYPSANSAWGETYIPQAGAGRVMVTAVYTATQIRLYIDGVHRFTAATVGFPRVDSNYGSAWGSSSPLIASPAPVDFWHGEMALASIWSGDKGSDVSSWYNAGKGLAYDELPNTTGLIAFYGFSESSGDRADSHGSNTLTDVSTVGSATNTYPANLPGRVASFVAANSETLSRAAINAFGADYTASMWVKHDVFTGTHYFFSAANGPYAYLTNTDNSIHVAHGSGNIAVQLLSGYTDWHHVVFWSDAGVLHLTVDGVAATPAAHTSPAETEFLLGGVSGIAFLTGRMSSVAIWPRVLTPEERAELYNSGDGAVLP